MSKSGRKERILVVIDGDNMSEYLSGSPYTLHQMIDACIRDFVGSRFKMVGGPAFFITLHFGTSDMKYRTGRLAHQILSEVAVPKRYKFRMGTDEFGNPTERGYDDGEIANYVMRRLSKFDTLFVFTSDFHFTGLIELVVNDGGKTAYICGDAGHAGDALIRTDYFVDLETLDLPEEPAEPKEQDSAVGVVDWDDFHKRALRLTGNDKKGWV